MAPAPQQKPISVWIGKIGSNVPDRLLRNALELVGGLLAWKRDGKGGVLRTFGFADFSSPLGALLAKTTFNDLPLGDSTLSVKIDEKTQKIIDAWSQDHPEQAQKTDHSSDTLQSILKLFRDAGIPAGPDVPKDTPSDSQPGPSSELTSTETNGENKEQNGSHAPANAQPNHRMTPAQKKLLWQEQRREEEKKRDLERKAELMEEDKERERKRLEKQDHLYHKLSRDFDEEQRERKAALERRERADEEAQKLRLEDLEDENAQLWGNEEECLRREKELRKKYTSTEFVKMRKREADIDADAKAEEEAERRAELRRLEEQHKDHVRKQQEEQAARMKAERERMKQNESRAEVRGDVSLSSSLVNDANSKKRTAQSQAALDREGGSKSTKTEEIQTPHSGLHAPSADAEVGRIAEAGEDASLSLTGSTSSLKLASLNAKIPSDVATLLSTPIRYDLLEQHNILETILKPWVTKKIFEYLEVEEATMIQFICTHIADHKPTQELIAQLQPVLDDDAQLFVITLTRLLLLESLKLEETN